MIRSRARKSSIIGSSGAGSRFAVGRDSCRAAASSPRQRAGPGIQISLYGPTGTLFTAREGLELNLLCLTLGIDPLGRR